MGCQTDRNTDSNNLKCGIFCASEIFSTFISLPSHPLRGRASLMLFWSIGGGIASFLESGLDCHPGVITKLSLAAFV